MIDNDFMLSLENALLVPRDYDHRGLRSQYTCSSTLPSRIESADKRKEITISPNRASSKRFDPNKEKGYPLEPNPGKLCTDVYRLDERDARPIFRGFRGGKR